MERNPYFHIEVEQAVIGTLFLDGELIKGCTLQPEHFYSTKLRNIYNLMQQLAEKANQMMLYLLRRKRVQIIFQKLEGGIFALSS
ncbi:DnaB-like helicase N-terminal domain-containing protein [Niallia sp. XMNu-256]|uniref:DnaB-like helicase N-terminal domain-containing protein n=1 Tax=Niallia sp. XMNu-256 TaxID=3082444 RepID=UPI0030D57B80